MRSNQQLIKTSKHQIEASKIQLDRSQLEQSGPIFQTKVQRRRSRSRQMGRRPSKIYQENRRNSIAEEMLRDPSYFEDKLLCQSCNRQTYNIIEKRGGNLTWFCCAIFSLVGGACFLPFFINGCLDTDIYCMHCNNLKRVDQASWMPA